MSGAGSLVTPNAPLPLDTCGCCGDPARATPEISNRPGLRALAYRIGTQPTFLRSMLSKLAALSLADDEVARLIQKPKTQVPLASLSTRSTDDPAIALLDAWATVADVLTFYQERIANEGYLRTATERRSVLELARAIGYELNPGVAASTYLAFMLDDARGAPRRATIDIGTKIQSVPGQNERPQTFETVSRIEARAEWNALTPRLTVPQDVGNGTTAVLIRGTETRLRLGDRLLFVVSQPNAWSLRAVSSIETGALDVRPGVTEPYTLIGLNAGLANLGASGTVRPRVYALRARANLFGYMAPHFIDMPVEVKRAYYSDYDTAQQTEWPDFDKNEEGDAILDLDAIYPGVVPLSWIVAYQATPTLRETLYRVNDVTTAARADFTLTAKVTRLILDGTVRATDHTSFFSRRDAVVFSESEELTLSEVPTTDYVAGKIVRLAGLVQGLEPGRALIVRGRRRRGVVTDAATGLVLQAPNTTIALHPGDVVFITAPPVGASSGTRTWGVMNRDGVTGTVTAPPDALRVARAEPDDPLVSEGAVIATIQEGEDETTLELEGALVHAYDPPSVVVHANVALATHGETVREVLGGGDGSRPNQRFALKRKALTYVAAATATGGRTTLTVRVNGVRWDEAPSLFELEPDSQSYIVRMDDDGVATVIFGDGHRGARPPSGAENIIATYRSGIGPEGEVRADTLTLLQTRPLGVRSVTNPLPASGSAAPERLAAARENAPLTVLTLDRIVSLRDFEDFAHAFGGIGKARATAAWEGERHIVHITVAGDDGAVIDPSQPLYENLVKAIDAARDPHHAVTVTPYTLLTFSLVARLLIDPRFVAAQVVTDVRSALLAAFAFDRRHFGQPVTAAEVLGVMQDVAGVLAVDLDSLSVDATANTEAVARRARAAVESAVAGRPTGRIDWSRIPTLAGTQSSVPPAEIIPPAGAVADTELLLINPRGIDLLEVTA